MRFDEFTSVGTPSGNPVVLEIQTILKHYGYDLGNTGPNGDGIDGVLGPKTKAAYDSFMKTKGTPKTVKKSSAPSMKKQSGNIMLPINAPIGQKFKGAKHQGVDIPAPVGTPVRAPEDGYVVQVANSPTAGLFISLGDAQGNISNRLLHLSKISVRQGQYVNQGDVVGLSGNTGHSTGPHLHWEKFASGHPTDPLSA